jgi:hypothetical protein
MNVRSYRMGNVETGASNDRNAQTAIVQAGLLCVVDRPQAVLADAIEILAPAYIRMAGFRRQG